MYILQMQEQFKAVFREQNARIRKLERELGKAHAQTVTVVASICRDDLSGVRIDPSNKLSFCPGHLFFRIPVRMGLICISNAGTECA